MEQQQIEQLCLRLRQRQMNGYYVQTQAELLQLLDQLIVDHAVVGCGDSVTLEQLEVFSYLRRRNIRFLDKHQEGLHSMQKRQIYLQNFAADVFISGCNAISLEGEIFDVDGNVSRVAPMIYGPDKVILIMGENKVVANAEQALQRIRQFAAVQDAQRLGKHTPCNITGQCHDCLSKERICNSFVRIAHQFDAARVHVIVIAGAYGF